MNTIRTSITSVLAVIALLATQMLCGAEIRYRKHVDDMTPSEWQTLADAIAQLQKADTFGPQGPATPAVQDPFPQSHNSYEWFVQIHGNRKEAGACKHSSEAIWPWHRAFLLHFENKLRATNPPTSSAITLPYWDWTETPSGQHGYPAAYEQQGSVLNHPRQQHDTTKTEVPLVVASGDIPQGKTASEFVDGLMTADWKAFGGTAEGLTAEDGTLESQLHNEIHGYIGRDNANTVHAVRDPIFWAHHANLDRLWDRWQQKHHGELQCFACDSVVYDRDPNMGPLKFSGVLSNDALPGAIAVIYLPKGTPVPMAAPLMVMAMTAAAPRVASPAADMTTLSFVMPESSGYRFALRFIDVRVPAVHAYHAAVYLYPADVAFSRTAAFRKKYKVGNFGMFASNPEEHPTQTITVDMTDVIRGLPRDQIGKPYRLTVQFRSADSAESYNAVAADIAIGDIELVRRDFATSTKIPLRQE